MAKLDLAALAAKAATKKKAKKANAVIKQETPEKVVPAPAPEPVTQGIAEARGKESHTRIVETLAREAEYAVGENIMSANLLALEAALLEDTPNIRTLLKVIHSTLQKNPATVTLLTPEECSLVVRGLQVQTKTEIASTLVKEAKKAKKGGKAASKIAADDL